VVADRPRLLDSTLREGEQVAGVRLSKEEKAHCLGLLEDFGIDLIEIGHPAISDDDLAVCTHVAKAARTAETLVHARATVDEVRAAARSGVQWVGIWMSASELSRHARWNGKPLDVILSRASAAVTEAKHLGLKVRLTVEDASRTPRALVEDLTRFANDHGADSFSVADTVGQLTPTTIAPLVRDLADLSDAPLEVHLHNDLGLAVANALTAVESGALIVDTTVLGLGERAGIVDLVQLATVLTLEHDDDRWDLAALPELALTVAHMARFQIEPHRPVVGRNAHTHVAKYHQDATQRDPRAYERMSPSLVGQIRHLAGDRPPLPDGPRPPYRLQPGRPFPRDAAELRYHRTGVGDRWVLVDTRIDPAAQAYLMKRTVARPDTATEPDPHVDLHVHHCPSALVFLGDGPDNGGFACEVAYGAETRLVTSPATVWIPAGVPHSFRIVSGGGEVLNLVLTGEYNSSLVGDDDPGWVLAPAVSTTS
jgi:2-isopropylmalate synthase